MDYLIINTNIINDKLKDILLDSHGENKCIKTMHHSKCKIVQIGIDWKKKLFDNFVWFKWSSVVFTNFLFCQF